MESDSPKRNQKGGSMLRWAIIGLGIVSCMLLFFADKTNLNTLNGTELQPQNQVSNAVAETENLPPLAPDPLLDEWRESLTKANGAEKIVLLDSIINRLELRGRYDYAAEYGAQLIENQRSLTNMI